MKRISVTMIALIPVALAGCGNTVSDVLPNRLVGGDGQEIVLNDLRRIANDSDLSEDDKIDAFRELGIEDEKLITALLDLPEEN